MNSAIASKSDSMNTGLFRFFLVAALSLSGSAVLADSGGQAFVETRLAAFPGTEGEHWQAVQRFQPNLHLRISDRAAVVVRVEAGLQQGRNPACELRRTLEDSSFGAVLESAGCHWPDPGHSVFRVHESGDYLSVDRLYLDLYQDGFDLRIGRQSLHWGSGQFFNPSDPFFEMLLAEPWRPRRGVNAVRATVPFGALNDVSAVLSIDDALKHPLAAARLRFDVMGVGAAVIGAWRGESEDGFVGLDLRGSNIIGWWLEAALFPSQDWHSEAVVGIDYSFPILERMVLFAQYYRKGITADSAENATARPILNSTDFPACKMDLGSAFDSNGTSLGAGGASGNIVGLSGRDYILLGSMVDLSQDLSFSAYLLQNLNDGTAVAVPTVSYLPTGRLELSLSTQLPVRLWGDGGEMLPSEEDLLFSWENPGNRQQETIDMSGLVPTATINFWAKLNF